MCESKLVAASATAASTPPYVAPEGPVAEAASFDSFLGFEVGAGKLVNGWTVNRERLLRRADEFVHRGVPTVIDHASESEVVGGIVDVVPQARGDAGHIDPPPP